MTSKTMNDTRVIDAYAGYATEEYLILRGRVLKRLAGSGRPAGEGVIANLRQMTSLFLTRELSDVTVHAGEVSAVTDAEGYFTLTLPRPSAHGWIDVPVFIDGQDEATVCSGFVPSPDAEIMVISDIDDTVLVTGAFSLARNLWTSLTGSVTSRQVYQDAVALIAGLSAEGRNPVFYVSSSPWNLFGFLEDIFVHNGLVRGPKFLRDFGIRKSNRSAGGHLGHKGGSIQILMRAVPDLTVVLIGDTGQKDAKIYGRIVAEFPNRVGAVVLRETSDGSDACDLGPIAEIEALGIAVFHAPQLPSADVVCQAFLADGVVRTLGR